VCHGGGFVASGDVGACDRWPSLLRSDVLSTIDGEGFGEVQTPLLCGTLTFFFSLFVGDDDVLMLNALLFLFRIDSVC
jgi:hypothetical protein